MDKEALRAYFSKLDRSHFINGSARNMAGLDAPLPIGHGQTISQPSLVLGMTQALSPEKDSKVLEIGTGSGYQTALLAAFSGTVYTVEMIPELAGSARRKLDALGFGNVYFRTGDGSGGWREHAPYDRIIATAAAGRLPQELVDQLAPGGRMVAPVGPRPVQDLLLVTKDGDGNVRTESLCQVMFVEFKGKYGWDVQ